MQAIKLNEIEKYEWEKNILEGLNFLKSFLNGGSKGNNGDKIYILEQTYNTQDSENINWEGHRRYIDIQYIVEGSEGMGFRKIKDMKSNVKYNEKKDFQFFDEIEKTKTLPITVSEGEFLIFFPDDIHKPCLGNGNKVKKIVVKVQIN